MLIVLTAMVVASLPGCGGDSPGSEATPSAVARGATSGDPSAGASSATGGGAPTVSPTDPDAIEVEARLSDTGLGDLKLNMSLKKAKALGWVGKRDDITDDDVCATYHGKRGVALLYFTHDRLIIIAAGPKIKLDTGLGLGDTYADLHGAYGDQLGSSNGSDGGGRIYIDAPGAPFPAWYRIGIDTEASFRDSKITEISLQSVNQECYE